SPRRQSRGGRATRRLSSNSIAGPTALVSNHRDSPMRTRSPMRKRSEPHTFEQRLAEHQARLEAEAAKLPLGSEREAVMKRLEQLQTATEMNKWLSQSA